jgi:hypothetical protein
MKLEEIFEEWSKDSDIDRTELGSESLKIAKLHVKYYKMFSNERLVLKKMEFDHKVLYKNKCEWLNGTMDQETLKELDWKPNYLKIMKSELSMYVDADQDIIKSNLKLSIQQEKVSVLESIIKSIHGRSFNIRAAIDWEKFKTGV